MKKALDVLINKVFKKDLELLYGPGCYVIINDIRFSEYQKKYLIDCKLMIPKDNPIEEFDLIYPDGLNIVMDKCWMFICVRETTQLLSTVDFF